MVVLVGTAFLALGLLNLDFGRTWWPGQRTRLLLGVPLIAAYVYIEMPPLVFPQAATLLLLPLVPNAAYALLVSARSFVLSRRIVSIRRTPFVPYLIALAVLGVFAGVLELAPVVDANGLRDVPDVTLSTTLPPQASLDHVRVVPEESAVFSGDKVVGQLGAYYRVGTYAIQADRGRLEWVAPLEFQGLVQWLARGTSPGVIIVSAENPNAAAELRARAPMRYIPSALLNTNLRRHVYMTYGYQMILDEALQLDDNGDPKYVCALGRPTIGWSGVVVTGVVIVDPTTGQMQYVPRDQFAALPKWVSRVFPPELALHYNLWFGLYVHGWWNAQLARRDVHLPARDEVFGLLVGNGEFVWFVDHTSPASTDRSMTGFTYMDAVNGKLTYYTASGGEFNSEAAESAVRANPIVRQGRLQPTQPVLYNAFGQNTWVVPVVADNGKFQTLALVQATNGHVTVGNVEAASPAADAFAQYGSYLSAGAAAPGVGSVTRTDAVIERFALAGDRAYFTIRGDRRVYALTNPAPDVVLTRAGDRVRFTATDDGQGTWLVRTFENRTVAR